MNNQVTIYLNNLLFHNSFFDGLIYFFAEILPGIIIIYALYFFVFSKKQPIKSLSVMLISASVFGLTEILKVIFNNPRPFVYLTEIQPLFVLGGYDSFPSGHASVFAAMATLVYLEDKKRSIIFFISAFLIGISRIISGVHHLYDILAGYLIGTLIVYLVYIFLGKITKQKT